MDMFIQFGSFNGLPPEACSLYGLLMLLASVWVVFNLKAPEKHD
jgi:hypothetical protein